ncbi:MAG: hypothetical protein GX771_07715 [Halomonadaceae bacterium]|nr:hypothetical protein [Halomonadaceae bacterium]
MPYKEELKGCGQSRPSKIDPRSQSTEALVAPEPLPYVSRRSLARVTDRVDPPTTCIYCDGEVVLVSNAKLYGREYGKWPFIYFCSGCGASVGLHPHTDLPLGTLADAKTKAARKAGKAWFMRWLDQCMVGRERKEFSRVRKCCYTKLAKSLEIPLEECHWGMFNTERAREAEKVCRMYLKQK